MTAIAVNEIGRGKRRGQIGESYTYGYSRWFMVKTSNPFDGPDEVMGPNAVALGLPQRGDPYQQPATGAYDSNALCIELTCQEQQEDETNKWLVEARYSSDYQPPTEYFDPTQDAPIFAWGNERITQALQNDVDGVPIQNSAGVPYQAVTVEAGRLTLTMQRNEYFYNASLAEDLLYTTNAFPQWNYDEGQVLLVEYSARGPLYKNGIEYWAHTYVFKFDDDDGFEYQDLLDQGKVEYGSSTTTLQPIILQGGKTVSDPVLLDGSGHARPQGPAVYNTFHIRDAADWTALALPDNITGP
jgi:hypothetical protein